MPVMGPYKSESGKYLLPMHEKVGGEKCAYAASGGRWRDARQEQGVGGVEGLGGTEVYLPLPYSCSGELVPETSFLPRVRSCRRCCV